MKPRKKRKKTKTGRAKWQGRASFTDSFLEFLYRKDPLSSFDTASLVSDRSPLKKA